MPTSKELEDSRKRQADAQKYTDGAYKDLNKGGGMFGSESAKGMISMSQASIQKEQEFRSQNADTLKKLKKK